MKNWLMVIALFLGTADLAIYAGVAKEDKKDAPNVSNGVEVAVKDIEDFATKNDVFLLNNISMKETVDEDNKTVGSLRVSAVIKNRTDKNAKYRLMLIGFDANKKPLWATTSSNSSLGAKDQSTFEDTMTLPAGTAKATATIWVKIAQIPGE